MKEIKSNRRLPQHSGWAGSGFKAAPLLGALAATVVLVAGCGKPRTARDAATPELPLASVRTQIIASQESTGLEEVVGTVRAKLRATLEAKATGRITEMPLVLGQKIQSTELLVRLDAPEINARLEQAEASFEQAERDWKRVSSLLSQQAATRADSDAADARYRLAKGTVAEARAMLGYVEIRAPFAGVVTRKYVDVGDLATPGKPLVELEDPTRLQFEADVPEAIASKIPQGAAMKVKVSEELPELTGTVREVAPVIDPVSRTLRVKLDLPDGTALRSGQFARLRVPVGQTTSLQVPTQAVIERGQMQIVFTVEDRHARLHLVKTGRQEEAQTEILSGLTAGEAVVVDDPRQLTDGQPVQEK